MSRNASTPNWMMQIGACVPPVSYDGMGLLVSTNRGGFTQRGPLPSSTYVPVSMSMDIQNAAMNVKNMRRDGNKAVPATPLAYLTKGFPGPYG